MNYPVIELIDKSNGISRRIAGWKVGSHLAVGYTGRYDRTFTIYSIYGQKPAIPHRFSTHEDAIILAKHLETVYGEYWEIHEQDEWKHTYIPELTQYTNKKMKDTFVLLSSLENKDTITLGDFQNALRDG